jgi:hypothetical protein
VAICLGDFRSKGVAAQPAPTRTPCSVPVRPPLSTFITLPLPVAAGVSEIVSAP